MKCNEIQPLLSEYIDGTLMACSVWEVDKHIVECNDCSRLLNEMRRTVELVAITPRFEVSADFMANLQTRLAQVEPAQPRATWLANLREMFRPRTLPIWGTALATCALAVIVFMPRQQSEIPGGGVPPGLVKPVQNFQMAKDQHVALTAANPMEDLSAANLDASDMESSLSEH